MREPSKFEVKFLGISVSAEGTLGIYGTGLPTGLRPLSTHDTVPLPACESPEIVGSTMAGIGSTGCFHVV